MFPPTSSRSARVLLLMIGIVAFLFIATHISNAAPPFLISANLPPPKGMDYFQTEDFLTKNGSTLLVHSANWDLMEPSLNKSTLKDHIANPFTLIVPKYPFKGVVLVLKMIDSNVRTMPGDIANKPFNDPQVEERFLAMLHQVALVPNVASKVNYILLGNEVDGYFKAHPSELDRFMDLLRKSINQLHRDIPGVQVGTITTFDSLRDPQLFKRLTQYSDFIDYTYYPLGDNWHMRPPSNAPGDIEKMSAAAASKRFGFTEIGYSTSPIVGSSEQQQVDFMKAVFTALEARKDQVAFINWASLGDSPNNVCEAYARQQHVPASDEFCGYAAHTGLRTYDNRPKRAWDIFVQEMKKMNSGESD